MLLTVFQPLAAVEYYRCTLSDGSTIFSETPCEPGARRQVIEDPRPTTGNGTSRSPIEQLQDYRNSVKRIDRLTGKGKKPVKTTQGACDKVTSLQLRNARISRDLMRCHSIDDVRAMFGNPDAVSSWSDRKAYDTRYLYRRENKERLYVYFNDGRVTKWTSHR